MSKFYEFKLKKNDGEDIDLSVFKGKVVLVVNSATNWGFTPQLKELSQMYDELKEKGFEILEVPCNQFNRQTPGSDKEVESFCTSHYGTKYIRITKSDVNGENELPLYTWLKEQKGFAGFDMNPMGIAMGAKLATIDKDYKNKPDIKWNFTKFLIDRDGNVIERFEPTHDMKDVRKKVEEIL